MTNRSHNLTRMARPYSRRRGFTLVEMLVVIGIALLLMGILLPSINRAYTQGVRNRMAADLQAIANALEAYRQDHGDYPRVTGTTHPGSVVLCKALIAPQAVGVDGQDGFGFRTRPTVGGTPQGRVYGPYLATDKFKIDNNATLPKILDRNGKQILYFPGFKTAQLSAANGYVGAFSYTNTDPAAIRPMFNTNDSGGMGVFDYDTTDANRGLAKFRHIMGAQVAGTVGAAGPTPQFTGEYLLWSAGPDERFGMPGNPPPTPAPLSPANKCDDVANFPRNEY